MLNSKHVTAGQRTYIDVQTCHKIFNDGFIANRRNDNELIGPRIRFKGGVPQQVTF